MTSFTSDPTPPLLTIASNGFSPFVAFTREEWARLRAATPLTLTDSDLAALRGINENISLDEVADIYLPLSRLLNLYVAATQSLHQATDTFLGQLPAKVPYVIGIAGSVAVGKSTTARILQALLARWPNHPKVDLLTTDGFLYPNRVLEERGLMRRKGFPESYDVRRLVRFMADVKSGRPEVTAPVYSHLTYDIVPDAVTVIRQPDIMIVEGLNVLQTSFAGGRHPCRAGPPAGAASSRPPASGFQAAPSRGHPRLGTQPVGSKPTESRGYHTQGVPGAAENRPGRPLRVFVSDFFDFSIYVDAEEQDIEQWYVDRFLTLRRTAFRNPSSYFHRYASLSVQEAQETARQIWLEINGVNLEENIEPTRERARLILHKARDHCVRGVKLRKL